MSNKRKLEGRNQVPDSSSSGPSYIKNKLYKEYIKTKCTLGKQFDKEIKHIITKSLVMYR